MATSSGAPAVSAADVPLVDACLRDGAGGSPTAVIIGDTAVSVLPSASHLAVIAPPSPDGVHGVRFFTSAGELPNCGHGTIAAIAVLTTAKLATSKPAASKLTTGDSFAGRLAIGGRLVEAVGRPLPGGGVEAWFDQGTVTLAEPDDAAVADVLEALGLDAGDLDTGDTGPGGADTGRLDTPLSPVIASPGRPRLLLPLRSRGRLAAIVPDQARLAEVSARHDLLGCFAYARRDEGPPPSGLSSAGGLAARMFAPAIGVPEDVANANSSGCLAAYLLSIGENPAIAVDQGDALGRPSTVYAEAFPTPDGIRTRVGGVARLR